MKSFITKIMIIVLGTLFALPCMAQFSDIPIDPFRSTSAMAGSGSRYTADPSLDMYGAPNYYAPIMGATPGTRPLKNGVSRGITIVFPDIPENPDDDALVPVGDAVLPLMLMALVFIGYILFRRKLYPYLRFS